jgi:hypothetical protein
MSNTSTNPLTTMTDGDLLEEYGMARICQNRLEGDALLPWIERVKAARAELERRLSPPGHALRAQMDQAIDTAIDDYAVREANRRWTDSDLFNPRDTWGEIKTEVKAAVAAVVEKV